MRSLDLTVLLHEGPMARAYLARLRRASLRPARIVLPVYSHSQATGALVGRWLPARFRTGYAARHQEVSHNHWPRQIRRSHPHLVDAIVRGMAAAYDGAADLIAEIGGPFEYGAYAESVTRVYLRDLADPALAAALRAVGGTVLFKGGGILRPALLDVPGVRFLHVHPGLLPHVRGGDGLLWSTLVRGRPGASCFVMDRGVDTGDLVAAGEFPALTFDVSASDRPSGETLYRALFSYYDPLLRAEMLRQTLLEAGDDVAALRAAPQDRSVGTVYHFMHPALRAAALARIFPDPV